MFGASQPFGKIGGPCPIYSTSEDSWCRARLEDTGDAQASSAHTPFGAEEVGCGDLHRWLDFKPERSVY